MVFVYVATNDVKKKKSLRYLIVRIQDIMLFRVTASSIMKTMLASI